MIPNYQYRAIIKWFTILFVTGVSLLMVSIQRDVWPFSSYSMFNFRFDLPDASNFVLFGFKDGNQNGIIIDNQIVLGAVRRGYLSRYCRKKIERDKDNCLQESLKYWVRRYRMFEKNLPVEIQGLKTIKLVETVSKKEVATLPAEEQP